MLQTALICLALATSNASPAVEVRPDVEVVDVGTRLEILEDPRRAWGIDDVRSPAVASRFEAAAGKTPNHGFTKSAYWYRVQVVSRLDTAQRLYLEMPYVIVDRVEFFIERRDAKGFRRLLMGDTIVGGGRVLDLPTYVVPIDLRPGERRRIFIRAQTEGSLQMPLKLWQPGGLIASTATSRMFYGPIIGLLLVLLIYNLVLFAMIRDVSYVHLALCVCAAFFYISYFTGIAQAYFFANSPWLANTGYPLVMMAVHVFIYLFTRRFLNLRQLMPRLDRVFVGFVGLGLLVLPLALLASYRLTLLFTIAVIVPGVICSMLTGAFALYRGYRPARYYVLGWSAFFVGIVIFAVEKAGLLPTNVVTDNGHVLGFLATLLMLPLGLADRINLLRREKGEAQARALEVQAEMAAKLEREVAHKTADLKDANEQLADRNAQLQREMEQRAQADKERVDLERSLFQSQKMDAIGRLAGGVAHDMNNILAVITLTTQGAQADLPPNGEAQEALDDVLSAAKRGGDLAKNLLGFARRGRYQKEHLDLNRSIAEINRLLRRTIHQGVEIRTNLAGDLHGIEGDPSQIGQVLVNLAVNAAHAMSDKGLLTFRTSNVVVGAEATGDLKGLTPGPYIQLEVSDTGAGMDQQTQAQVFEPFFTTKPAGEGTGLGLSMVYGAVQAHGGRVTIDSVVDEGTTFCILLPATTAPAPQARRTPSMRLSTAPPTGAVLLVDDEPMLRRSTARLLRRLGYTVLQAEHGEQALERFQAHQDQIVAVLLDLVMPVMDGPETFHALRSIDPEVRVVLSSGFSEEGDAADLLEQGAMGFLQKPYELDALKVALKQAIV